VEIGGHDKQKYLLFLLFLFFYLPPNIIHNVYKNIAEAYVLVTNEKNYVIFAVIDLEYL